jgi:hypothetical protein
MPSFEEFREKVRGLLTLVPLAQIELGIESLYGVVQSKFELEDLRSSAQAEVASLRQSRTSIASTRAS